MFGMITELSGELFFECLNLDFHYTIILAKILCVNINFTWYSHERVKVWHGREEIAEKKHFFSLRAKSILVAS